MATCPDCGRSYTGQRACHCGACHETFSGPETYDAHRHHRGEHGGCLDPTTVLDTQRRRRLWFREGMWRGPEMSPAAKTQARAKRGR